MRKKLARIILLCLVTAMAISFVACGNNGEYIEPSFEPGTKIYPSGKIKAATYLRSGEASEIAFDEWIKSYQRDYPDVQVKPEIIAWSDFGVKIAAGDIADVYYGCESNVYSYGIVNKAAMPLDAYIDILNIDITSVFTGLYELGCANGKLFMVPSDLCPAVFFTNVSMLTEAGIDMPDLTWTYDDFVNICKKVQKVGEDGAYEQVGMHLTSAWEQIVPFLTGWGGKWVDPVNKKVNLSSDDKVLQGLNQVIELISKGYMKADGLSGEVGAKFANISGPANYAFELGTYVNRITRKESYDQLGLEMNVTCIPELPVKRVIFGGCTGFFVYSKTKNPDAAATFALYLLKDEGQRAYNSSYGGGVPTTKACYEADYWRFPYTQDEFNYDAFICYPEAFVGNWPEVYVPAGVTTYLYKFADAWLRDHFNNKKDFKDACKETEQACNEEWSKIYEGDR